MVNKMEMLLSKLLGKTIVQAAYLPYWDSLLLYFLIIVLFFLVAFIMFPKKRNDLKLLLLAAPFLAFFLCLI